MIVEVKIFFQRWEEFATAGKVAGVDQFVFERAPQPFDEDIVQRSPAAIHTDRDAALLERSQEVGRGELRTLIGVPDFRLAKPERGVERGQAEGGFHGIGKFPTEYVTAEPVHDRDQIEKAALHRNIGNIAAPDMIGPLDGDAAQQVRVDLVVRVRAAQIGFGIVRFDPQNPH